MTHPSVNSIVERLQFDAARCELQFSKGVAENISEAATIISELQAALYLEKNKSANLEQNYHEVSTRLEARVAELQATVKRLTANPADQRYWEGRYRDEAAALSRIKEETIEECARIAEQTGNFGDYRRDELTADYGQPRFDMMNAIASAIRSLGSTGGGRKDGRKQKSRSNEGA